MDAQLSFGFGTSTITPAREVDLEGYDQRLTAGTGNSGVLDPLFVRVLWLHSSLPGLQDLVLVSFDLCLLTPGQADGFRSRVACEFDIPAAQVVVSCTHTHSGPVTTNPWQHEHAALANAANAQWFEGLGALLIQAIATARDNLQPGILQAMTASVALGYNRRLPLANGSVQMLFSLEEHPGKVPTGIVDKAIPALVFAPVAGSASGSGSVLLLSCPYHPVVLGKQSRVVSADYPGATIAAWEARVPGSRAMFLLGACGDTQPMSSTGNAPAAVASTGQTLASALLAAYTQRVQVAFDGFGLRQTTVGQHRLQALKIGRAALAVASAECFTELGLQLRKTPGWDQILVATNTNGWTGYLPTEEAFAQGGYEVEGALASGARPETLGEVGNALAGLLAELAESSPGQ